MRSVHAALRAGNFKILHSKLRRNRVILSDQIDAGRPTIRMLNEP